MQLSFVRPMIALLAPLMLVAFTTPDAAAEEYEGAKYENYPGLGKPAPQFAYKDEDGVEGETMPARGRTQVIEFWGVWCPDCMLDAPRMEEVRQAAAEMDDVNVLAIHVRGTGRYESLDQYFAESGYDFPTLTDPHSVIAKLYGVQWYPTYLVVDPAGTVTHMQASLSHADGVNRLLTAVNAARATPTAE